MNKRAITGEEAVNLIRSNVSRDNLCADGVYFDNSGGEKMQTNADRIRAMSDEKLGRFLAEVENRRSAAGGGAIWKGAAHAIQWLKQPAEVREA